jgi:hypothetical protein
MEICLLGPSILGHLRDQILPAKKEIPKIPPPLTG